MDDNTSTFVIKAKNVHGDKYNYKKSVYVDSKTKIIITCAIHGDFQQTPSNHYKYQCSKCSIEDKSRTKIAEAQETFLDKAILVHGKRYDLSKVCYQGSANKIKVCCNYHGEFEIAAKHFLSGSGCKKCGKEQAAKKVTEKAKNEFEGKARIVHKKKYFYSNVTYTGYTNKVSIICPIHGEFLQTPRKHLEGSGCHECGSNKKETFKAVPQPTEVKRQKLTTESFIERAKQTHGEKYNYKNTVFTKSHTPLTIICPLHGEFKQNPYNHLKGAGCKKCAVQKSFKTEEQFIKQAQLKHNNFFGYSKIQFQSMNEPVTIICPFHGEFNQKPTSHLQGFGCSQCQKPSQLDPKKTDGFIEEANQVHNFAWKYDKTVYKNTHEKVIITCPEHGDFQQTPASHKRGRGCPICGALKGNISQRLTTEQFILKAQEIHDDKYDYALSKYETSQKEIKITCKSHGVFEQAPSNHMQGIGCPLCAKEKISDKLSLPFSEFEIRARKKHGNIYLYKKSNYKRIGEKAIITCPEHGDFEQVAYFHVQGGKCPTCWSLDTRMQAPEFIAKAKEVHGERYNYDRIECNGVDSIVSIKCNTHGIFQQKVQQHLLGSGCEQCYRDSTKLNQTDFILDCNKAHSAPNDYSHAVYENIRPKIEIICSQHPAFTPTANDHKHGGGCPRCAEYFRNLDNKDPNTPCYLYYLTLKHGHLIFYKIGITTKGVSNRFKTLGKDGVKIVEQTEVLTSLHKAIEAEQDILHEFKKYKLLMSDVLLTTRGGTECFSDDVMEIHGVIIEDYL